MYCTANDVESFRAPITSEYIFKAMNAAFQSGFRIEQALHRQGLTAGSDVEPAES